MAAEGIARVDLVIDANGLAKTGRSLQTLERYMDKLRKRAEALSRVQVTLNVKLSDCLCGPMKAIRTKLTELTSRIWEVSVRAKFEMDRKLLEKIKTTVKVGVETEVKLNIAAKVSAESESGGDSLADIFKDGVKDWLKDQLKKFLDRLFGTGESPAEKCGCTCGDKADPCKEVRAIAAKGLASQKGASADAESRKVIYLPRRKPKSVEMPDEMPKPALPEVASKGGGKVVPFPTNRTKNLTSTIERSKKLPKAGLLGDIPEMPGTGAAKMLSKVAGKVARPIALVNDVASIVSAKPGKERNKAIGRAAGGWAGAWGGAEAGAAIGTLIAPGIGTAIGGFIGGVAGGMGGSALGDYIGGKASKIAGKIKKVWPFGKKKKKTPEAVPAPSATISPLSPGLSPVPHATPSSPVNVNIPTGAVQLTVQNPDIDYDAIANEIGTRMSASIKQAVENRAS